MSDKILSEQVRQGWRVVSYAVNDMGGTALQHNFLLERNGLHKVLSVRQKILGQGVVTGEMEV